MTQVRLPCGDRRVTLRQRDPQDLVVLPDEDLLEEDLVEDAPLQRRAGLLGGVGSLGVLEDRRKLAFEVDPECSVVRDVWCESEDAGHRFLKRVPAVAERPDQHQLCFFYLWTSTSHGADRDGQVWPRMGQRRMPRRS